MGFPSAAASGKLRAVSSRRLVVALFLVAVTAGAACSSAASGGAGVGPTSAVPATRSTRTSPPAPSVVLGGDSVMEGLVPAVRAALGNQAHVEYLAAPTISTASDRAAWRSGIETGDPDLVVVLVGTWEVLQPGFAPTEPGWADTYGRQVMDPLAASLTAGGARVLWVEMHSSTRLANTLSFAVLGSQARALAERNDAVDVIDAGDAVDRPGDVLADVLPGPDGTPERIRRLDGTGVHLCPAGVVRLARSVLAWIAEHAGRPLLLEEGWEVADWRWPPALADPEQCPPGSDAARSTADP